MENFMEMELKLIVKAKNIRVNGHLESARAKVSKLGQMEIVRTVN